MPEPITDASRDTQQKILDAAFYCVQTWGIDKTSMNDIARQAGVTRPTVYAHFAAREEIIRAALLQSGHALAQRLLKRMHSFNTAEERLLESVVFAVAELPQQPYLALLNHTDISSYISVDALNDPQGLALCTELFQAIFLHQPLSEQDFVENMELTIRMTLSLIATEGPQQRDENALRGFLRRRLLPAISFPQP